MSSNNRNNPGDSLLFGAASGTTFKLLSIERVCESPPEIRGERTFLVPDSLVLVIAEASEGRLVLDGRYYPLKAGSVFLGRPGQLLELGLHEERGLGVYVLRLQAADLSIFPAQGDICLAPSAVAIGLCEKMAGCLKDGSMAERLRGEAAFYELLSLIARQREHETAVALECARRELENHFTEEITVKRLADTAGLSRYHFMRLFKEKFGKGVIDYLTDLRLAQAKKWMEAEPGLSLRQISHRVGYKNESYFSSIFKKKTGFSAAVYIQNRQMKVAAYSWVNIGQLLALQVIPFAAPTDHYWTDEYRQKFAFEVKIVLSHQYDYNREALRQARPDRIVAIEGLIEEEERARLRDIAPSLFLPMELSWREHLRLTAEFLDMPAAAERWLEHYERRLEEFGRKSSFSGDRVLAFGVCRHKLLVWGRRAGSLLYDDLKWRPALRIDEFPSWTKEVDANRLSEFEADRLLLHVGEDAVSQQTWRLLERSAEWNGLKAVQNGSVQPLKNCSWFDCPWNEYNAYRFGQWLDEML
ncbi:AraC family transcriptional regulator [Cohnella cellulosilytica]|uniref:AraC family transcriptional regulator n=1 Tax=Cohnella cellulosilytica TaxID=986710 RepID=A0ABW2FFM0_9BACL